jgi:hypothetical protein
VRLVRVVGRKAVLDTIAFCGERVLILLNPNESFGILIRMKSKFHFEIVG